MILKTFLQELFTWEMFWLWLRLATWAWLMLELHRAMRYLWVNYRRPPAPRPYIMVHEIHDDEVIEYTYPRAGQQD